MNPIIRFLNLLCIHLLLLFPFSFFFGVLIDIYLGFFFTDFLPATLKERGIVFGVTLVPNCSTHLLSPFRFFSGTVDGKVLVFSLAVMKVITCHI